jgi:hypothetical protein
MTEATGRRTNVFGLAHLVIGVSKVVPEAGSTWSCVSSAASMDPLCTSVTQANIAGFMSTADLSNVEMSCFFQIFRKPFSP